MLGLKKFNHAQLEKSADLLLEVAKTMLLGTVLGALFPGVSEKIGLQGVVIGFIICALSYILSMLLLKDIKGGDKK